MPQVVKNKNSLISLFGWKELERLKNNHYITREERNKFRRIYFCHVHDMHVFEHGKNIKKY